MSPKLYATPRCCEICASVHSRIATLVEAIQGDGSCQAEDFAFDPFEEVFQHFFNFSGRIDVLVLHEQSVIQPVLESELQPRGQFPTQSPKERAFTGNACAKGAICRQ